MSAAAEAGDAPLVSVVVPSYGRPHELRGCLDALARLDYPAHRFEVVVVDDGSPEPLASIPGGADRPEVTVIRQANRGPAVARNRGATVASGEILAFTDDDCRPHPEWLAHLVAPLEDEPSALVGGRTRNAVRGNPFADASQDLIDFLYDYFPDAVALRPFFTSNNMAVRREPFLAVGGFEESFRFSAGEDRDLSERWAADVGPLRLADPAVVDHHHAMSAARFVRQHFRYGRGGMHLARRRRLRGQGAPTAEPVSFYMRMLRYPLARHPGYRGFLISALLVLAQAVNLSGIAFEAAFSSDPNGRDGARAGDR
jgi:GT2 family glycosyltransferase